MPPGSNICYKMITGATVSQARQNAQYTSGGDEHVRILIGDVHHFDIFTSVAQMPWYVFLPHVTCHDPLLSFYSRGYIKIGPKLPQITVYGQNPGVPFKLLLM